MPAAEKRPVVERGIFPWLPWPLRAMRSFARPVRAERLAAMRIGLALFLLMDVVSSYWPNRAVFFGPDSLGSFASYEWYAQDGKRWWSILRGPGDDLNFTLAVLGAIGIFAWMVMDTRTRWLGTDRQPPRPSPWLVVLWMACCGYALAGYWARVLRDPKLDLDSRFRFWMWLAPVVLVYLAALVWAAELWVTWRPRRSGTPAPPRGYLHAWYVTAWGFFPLLVVAGFVLHLQEWGADETSWVRTALEPWMLDHTMITAAMIAWMASLVLLLVGFQTRVAAIVAWVLSSSFANVQPHIDNAGDTIRGIILFYLMLCPCGAAWSIDAWRDRKRPGGAAAVVSPWPICLLFVQLVFIYFINGMSKIFSTDWREGRTLYYVLNDVTLTRFAYDQLPVTFEMTEIMTLATLAWELSFPFLALSKWTRIPALIFGVGFHLGIGLSMDLGFFAPYVLCIYLSFLPWEKLADRYWRPPVVEIEEEALAERGP